MRLLKLNSYYPSYIAAFYRQQPHLWMMDYAEQKQAFFNDAFSAGNAWTYYLAPHGYMTDELIINADPLERRWAYEAGLSDDERIPLDQIIIAQVQAFNPEILWFESLNRSLLAKIRSAVPGIRLVIGWVGSAIRPSLIWKEMDLVLSCASESVTILKAQGVNVEHIDHGFDPRILPFLPDITAMNDLIFIGQLIRKTDFHLLRERMLEELAYKVRIILYNPALDDHRLPQVMKIHQRRLMYDVVQFLLFIGIGKKLINKIPGLKNTLRWTEKPDYPAEINPKLKRHMRPGLYGMDMYTAIKKARITLNIHADTSPRYASNMRLFETTGVGSCLLTDWKPNITGLFEPNSEVITYRTLDECVEKAEWLLNHEDERKKIASAGQTRTLKDHTFTVRAEKLHQIIKKQFK